MFGTSNLPPGHGPMPRMDPVLSPRCGRAPLHRAARAISHPLY